MRFIIEEADDDRYGFSVVADDGRLLATGVPYSDKGSALAAIAELMQGLDRASIHDRARTTGVGEGSAEDMATIGRSGTAPV